MRVTPKYICFFDLETSGLRPVVHDIIQIAAVRTDLQLKVLDTFETKVQFDSRHASPRALEVNGYTKEAWEGAISLSTALEKLQGLLSSAYPAGHNVTRFDLPWLEVEWNNYPGWRPAQMAYHVLDTMSLAWPLFFRREIPNLKLETLCKHFGVVNEKVHDALGDVMATIEVAKHLMGRTVNE